MCGVIGLVHEHHRETLGRTAAELLKTLEYRGYDSTGAVIQGEGPEDIRLVKGVGAPSTMVHQLGITAMAGSLFCGQVRWATFGAVDERNAQPHRVGCRANLYGAHNGNVTNCDELKEWLTSEGHRVASDNDGEMVVHTVEHFFAQELEGAPLGERGEGEVRRRAMRAALLRACGRLQGSFAAVIADPVSRRFWAVKAGSSLYFGFGRDEGGSRFALASSDLSSVLKLTRVLVPLREDEIVEYTPQGYALFRARDDGKGGRAGEAVERAPVRSRLRAKDIALRPPFETFMDQEISAQEGTARAVVTLFTGGSEDLRAIRPTLEAHPEAGAELAAALDPVLDLTEDDEIRGAFHRLAGHPATARLAAALPEAVAERLRRLPPAELPDRLASSEAGFLADLVPMARGPEDRLALRLLDALLEAEEVRSFDAAVRGFLDLCDDTLRRDGRIYVVSCGSSFHAAKAAALFFDAAAAVELIPVLPGEFRAQYSRSIRDGDLFLAVSQSGETKDLIDVLNQIAASGRRVHRVALVNNVNSTLAQEKADLVLPLRCGPEIAVPATKSFINQMTVLYCLALRLGERRAAARGVEARGEAEATALRLRTLPRLPLLLREAVEATAQDVDRAAQMLFLAPSIHLLATRLVAVAKEGALKIREVVLNHTEGFEGSEFKHGPNTILGINTVFGPAALDALLQRLARTLDLMLADAAAAGLPAESLRRLAVAAADAPFRPQAAPFALTPDEQPVFDRRIDREGFLEALYADYPLIYVTGPEERDVLLTVSQINTHKIRGASTVVVAEEHPALRGAAAKAPADNPDYASVFIPLPRTGDTLMTVFSATVVLQRLALEMSLRKMRYLDRLGLRDHGVHPDVPKNVSKSITVD